MKVARTHDYKIFQILTVFSHNLNFIERTKAFGHGNHVKPEHVNVLLGLLVITRMIGTHMIDDFGGLSKARFVAT